MKSQQLYIDAHVHIGDFSSWIPAENTYVCSCAHSPHEFAAVEKALNKYHNVVPAYGIHPQNPDKDLYPFLEELVIQKRVKAIGECGFDLFTPDFISSLEQQKEVWTMQLELAVKHSIPLVIHCRRAMNELFGYTQLLKKLPAVIFHAFPGSTTEAQSLFKRGVQGYFSFGKELIKGRKQSIGCLKELPLELILLETDAPYQTLKHQKETPPEDIFLVYQKAATVLECPIKELIPIVENNFKRALLEHF